MSLVYGGNFSATAANKWAYGRAIDNTAVVRAMALGDGAAAAYTGSQAILIMSDSTGVEPDASHNWPWLMAGELVRKHPDMAIIQHVWDANAQDYGPAINRSGNDPRHLVMAASDGTARTRSLDNALVGAFADLDLAVDIALDDWTPGTSTSIAGQWGSSGTYGHRLQLLSTGGLRYQWTTDGTTQVTANSTATLGFADGSRHEVRVTHDVDNGSGGNTVTFWHRAPGEAAWTQLGNTVVTTGTTSIYRPAARMFEIGGTQSTTVLPGKYYGVVYRNGIGGPIVSPQPIDVWLNNEDKTPIAGAPTLHVYCACQSGAGINPANPTTSGFLQAARLPMMVPPLVMPMSVILNTGHNEVDNGAAYAATLDSWLAALKPRLPVADFFAITQNPVTTVMAERSRKRLGILVGWARRNGVGIIDTYTAWLQSGTALDALLQADGLHPTSAGAAVSAAVVAGFVG